MKLFERCKRKKLIFLKTIKEMPVYITLRNSFRNNLFDSLNLKQREIAKTIKCSSTGEVSEIVRGLHLLTIERLNCLLKLNKLSWNKVIDKIVTLRIGQVGYIKPLPEFVQFILKEKKLI